MFPVGKAISLLENNFSSLRNKYVPCKVPALSVRLKIRINGLCGGIALRGAHTSTESNGDHNFQWPDGHRLVKPRSNLQFDYAARARVETVIAAV